MITILAAQVNQLAIEPRLHHLACRLRRATRLCRVAADLNLYRAFDVSLMVCERRPTRRVPSV
jgi:hypothetical protein